MNSPRVLLRSVVNFRDIGGFPAVGGRRVRRGRVFRSGHFSGISDEDLQTLRALGIRKVIDFRTSVDIEDEGSGRLPQSMRRVNLPMGDPATGPDLRELILKADRETKERHLGHGQAVEMMKHSAAALVTERTREYGQMVRHLIEPGGIPAIVHCSAGKDRTGWAASLILLIAGVHRDDVVGHYVESNAYRVEENARMLRRMPEGIDPDWLRPFFEVRPEYARASLAAVDEHFQGVEGYLTAGLGLTLDEVEQLRELLLE